jgi:hypothetical protein
MSKELEKFEAEYKKKIKAKVKPIGSSEAQKLKKRISLATSGASTGEDYLTESMVPAFKAGITGTKLTDFMANKDFKDGYTAYKKAVEMLAEEMVAAIAMQKAASAVYDDAAKLDAAITKDLKKRKDKSNSKSDIEKLQKELRTVAADLKPAMEVYDKQPPFWKKYAAEFPKKVNAILKTPPAEALRQKDATELPQMLQDRNLKANTNKAAGLAKMINAKVSDAMKIAETDLKKSVVPLKEAATALKGFKTLNDQYAKIVGNSKYKAMVDNSKDKASIMKSITAMQKAFDDCERKVRGTMATIKKAG